MKFPSLKGFDLAIDGYGKPRGSHLLEVSIPQRVRPRYRLADYVFVTILEQTFPSLKGFDLAIDFENLRCGG